MIDILENESTVTGGRRGILKSKRKTEMSRRRFWRAAVMSMAIGGVLAKCS